MRRATKAAADAVSRTRAAVNTLAGAEVDTGGAPVPLAASTRTRPLLQDHGTGPGGAGAGAGAVAGTTLELTPAGDGAADSEYYHGAVTKAQANELLLANEASHAAVRVHPCIRSRACAAVCVFKKKGAPVDMHNF